MKAFLQRTQIYLPNDLRQELERYRSGESLSEYLRIAARERLRRQKKKKADLKKLADEVIGVAKGLRSEKEIEEWEKEIREDRRLSDERMLKRWDEAKK
jgi:metal-responsive CopG/Arc/MetJ family transcriptional regulator